MAQEEILNLINSKVNYLWSSREIKDNVKLTQSSVVQSLRALRTTDWIGYIGYKDCRYYYFNNTSPAFKCMPRIIHVNKGVKGLSKDNILDWLRTEYSIEVDNGIRTINNG